MIRTNTKGYCLFLYRRIYTTFRSTLKNTRDSRHSFYALEHCAHDATKFAVIGQVTKDVSRETESLHLAFRSATELAHVLDKARTRVLRQSVQFGSHFVLQAQCGRRQRLQTQRITYSHRLRKDPILLQRLQVVSA